MEAFDLYSLPRGPWRTIAGNPGLDGCADIDPGTCAPLAIGAHWFDYFVECYHCAATHVFENVATGVLKDDPTAGRVIPNLGSTNLRHTACRAIHVTAGDTVTFEGSFALIFQPTSVTSAPGAGSYSLARCGSDLHQQLGGEGVLGLSNAGLAATPKAVLWEDDSRTPRLLGLLLPGRRRLQIPVPKQVGGMPYGVVLSSRHLYLNGADGRLWKASLPPSLQASTH
jgi:hypothetical protein